MDLLDGIMGSMTKTDSDKKKPVKRPKPEVKSETEVKKPKPYEPSTSGMSGTSSSFSSMPRIPKKTAPPPVTPTPSWGPTGKMNYAQSVKQESPANVTAQRVSAMSISSGDMFKAVDTIPLEINLMALDLSRTVETNQFHVIVKGTKTVKDKIKEKDLTIGPRNDIARQLRQDSLISLMRQIYKSKPDDFGNKYSCAYDGGNTLYSITLRKNIGKMVILMTVEEINDRVRPYFKKLVDDVTIEIVYTGTVCLDKDKLMSMKSADAANLRASATRFLEILTSQTLYEGDNISFQNKAFEKSSRQDKSIGQGKVVKCGLEKNVRIIGGSESLPDAMAAMQISSKRSPFYAEMPLLKFIDAIERDASRNNYGDLVHNDGLKKKVHREIKDITAVTTHLPTPYYFIMHGIAKKSANTQTFEIDGRTVSVYEYFLEHHKRRLEYPDLPLVIEKKGARLNYHPMEVILVPRGSRAQNNRLTGKQRDDLISNSRLLPNEMRNEFTRLSKDSKLDGNVQNKYLEAFGIFINPQFMGVKGTILYQPRIGYLSEELKPTRFDQNRGGAVMWRTQGQRYRCAAKADKIAIIVFDRCFRDEDSVRRFYDNLVREGRSKGMSLPDSRSTRIYQLSSEQDDRLDEFFRKMREEKCNMIIALTREKKDNVHSYVKVLEARHNIVTQHLWSKTAEKISTNGMAVGFAFVPTISNVILKINGKLGGVNHEIRVPTEALIKSSNPVDVFANRMFVGFELSHAEAQCHFDREHDVEVREPTVVGMSFTMSMNTHLGGHFWFQKPREARITEACAHFARALHESYRQNKNRLPKQIIIYRSGTSEGEFQFIPEEIDEMRKAYRNVAEKYNQPPDAPFVVIVAQANSNYRVLKSNMPDRGNALELNAPSGTCIHSNVVDPTKREFILIAQKAAIGTARPMKYTTVVNDANLTLNELEHMTYWLSFAHQVSTNPTHSPNVLFAAGNLAKRGRDCFKYKYLNDDSASSGSSRVRLQGDETLEGFYLRASKELNNALSGAYWS